MRSGTGAYPLRGHNNVQGASDHGAMPNYLPGYQLVDDPEVARRFEAGWKIKLPSTKGFDNHEMIEAIHPGKLKGMYLFRRGNQPGGLKFKTLLRRAWPNSNSSWYRIFFFSDTCRFADVVVAPPVRASKRKARSPAPSGRIQRLYEVFEPLEGSRPDWRIIQEIANRLGLIGISSIRPRFTPRFASLTPLFAGVTYERLEGYKSLQMAGRSGWQRPNRCYTRSSSISRTAKQGCSPLTYSQPTDQVNEEISTCT